jgi:molybdopterin/thiamine biosynthesis adenylyltransferase
VIEPIIILPQYYAERIIRCRKDYGLLYTRADDKDHVFLVDGFAKGQHDGQHKGGSRAAEMHYAAHAQMETRAVWYRAEPELHLHGMDGRRRSGALPLDTFKSGLHGSWIGLTRGGLQLCVTYAQVDDDLHDWRAWILSEDQGRAQVTDIQVVDEEIDLFAPLQEHWPLDELAGAHAVVVGAGSIGSHANDALVSYGIRRLSLVDPDRLLKRNFARHRTHTSQIGRFKVHAERDRLLHRDAALTVDPLPLDVIYDADVMRPLFAEADVVIVTSDGIDSRRTANHIACRAGTSAIFACVLANGAYGEILRITPAVGCLLCARAELRERGGIAPESTLDRGYGAGTRHLPMTAVTGDLGLVGQLAAKAAVATCLEPKGFRDQRLPGDHAVIGLRPLPGKPAPFNLEEAGKVSWTTLPPPRLDCPTCGSS